MKRQRVLSKDSFASTLIVQQQLDDPLLSPTDPTPSQTTPHTFVMKRFITLHWDSQQIQEALTLYERLNQLQSTAGNNESIKRQRLRRSRGSSQLDSGTMMFGSSSSLATRRGLIHLVRVYSATLQSPNLNVVMAHHTSLLSHMTENLSAIKDASIDWIREWSLGYTRALEELHAIPLSHGGIDLSSLLVDGKGRARLGLPQPIVHHMARQSTQKKPIATKASQQQPTLKQRQQVDIANLGQSLAILTRLFALLLLNPSFSIEQKAMNMSQLSPLLLVDRIGDGTLQTLLRKMTKGPKPKATEVSEQLQKVNWAKAIGVKAEEGELQQQKRGRTGRSTAPKTQRLSSSQPSQSTALESNPSLQAKRLSHTTAMTAVATQEMDYRQQRRALSLRRQGGQSSTTVSTVTIPMNDESQQQSTLAKLEGLQKLVQEGNTGINEEEGKEGKEEEEEAALRSKSVARRRREVEEKALQNRRGLFQQPIGKKSNRRGPPQVQITTPSPGESPTASMNSSLRGGTKQGNVPMVMGQSITTRGKTTGTTRRTVTTQPKKRRSLELKQEQLKREREERKQLEQNKLEEAKRAHRTQIQQIKQQPSSLRDHIRQRKKLQEEETQQTEEEKEKDLVLVPAKPMNKVEEEEEEEEEEEKEEEEEEKEETSLDTSVFEENSSTTSSIKDMTPVTTTLGDVMMMMMKPMEESNVSPTPMITTPPEAVSSFTFQQGGEGLNQTQQIPLVQQPDQSSLKSFDPITSMEDCLYSPHHSDGYPYQRQQRQGQGSTVPLHQSQEIRRNRSLRPNRVMSQQALRARSQPIRRGHTGIPLVGTTGIAADPLGVLELHCTLLRAALDQHLSPSVVQLLDDAVEDFASMPDTIRCEHLSNKRFHRDITDIIRDTSQVAALLPLVVQLMAYRAILNCFGR